MDLGVSAENDNRCALGLDALHNALNRTLAEIIAVGFHGQTIYADNQGLLSLSIPLTGCRIISCLFQNLIRNEILAGAIRLDDGLDQILRDIRIIGQQLFGVFRQAISAITERRVIVVSPNTGIQTNSENNGLGIQSFYLGISIQFIEVADSKGQVGIGKELYSFSLFQTHKQRIDILFDGPFLQQCSKRMGGLLKRRNICDGSNGIILLLESLIVDNFGNTHNNTARIEIVVESFAFTQEFG